MANVKWREHAGMGSKPLAFLSYPLSGHTCLAGLSRASPMPMVYEPGKGYGDFDNHNSSDAAETGVREENVFTRIDRLRSNVRENTVKAQLERLQGIAALMQMRDQGPMPGEMLKVYAWEVEDVARILMKHLKGAENKNSEARRQNKKQ